MTTKCLFYQFNSVCNLKKQKIGSVEMKILRQTNEYVVFSKNINLVSAWNFGVLEKNVHAFFYKNQ